MKEELNCCRYLLKFYYLYLFKINVFSYYFQVVVRVIEMNEIHDKSSSDNGLMVNKSDEIEEKEQKIDAGKGVKKMKVIVQKRTLNIYL